MLGDLKKCCYNNLDPNIAFETHHAIVGIIPKPLSFGYYLKKSTEGNGLFLVFLSTKLVDFISDVTVNYYFYKDAINSNDTFNAQVNLNETSTSVEF